MKSESKLQAECLKWCRSNNILAFNIHQGGMTGKGIPDLILCINGKFVAMELKVKNNKLSPAQLIRRKQILEARGEHFAPYSLQEFIEIVKELTYGNTHN